MRLKQLRKQKRISQVKLAIDLGMSQNSVSRYETGEREADYHTLILIADYFNVSLDYLLERTDNPKMNAPLTQREKELLAEKEKKSVKKSCCNKRN